MKLLYLHDKSIDSDKANVIQVLHMCYAFAELGQQVCLAIPANSCESDDLRQAVRHQIGKDINFSIKSYRNISIGRRLSMLGSYPGARQLLKSAKADCCFVRNPVLINATLKRNLPTIFESHNASIHDNFLLNVFWTGNLVKNCKQKKLLKFIAISESLAEKWKAKGIPPHKVISLHDGVDIDSFRIPSDIRKLRTQLGLPANKKIVLYGGSLYADRGIDKILALAKNFIHTCFAIIGGSQKNIDYYTKRAQQQKITNIIFAGRVPHHKVRHYLMAADVLLMVWSTKVRTINYCSPLKMFEYMAAGKIIVGHGFPTIREVLTDGKNALLVNPDSFDELKAKLALALSYSYPNNLAANARRLALEKYSWKTRASKILASINVNYG
jgi:glycosyltransferase involved in cell wall biosynthesis